MSSLRSVITSALTAVVLAGPSMASSAAHLAQDLGLPLQGQRHVESRVPRDGTLLTVPDQYGPDRAYSGEVLTFDGLTVEQLTFVDPGAAFDYAQRHVQPPAVVEVRGNTLIAVSGPKALEEGLANRALERLWTGPQGEAPRGLLLVADEQGDYAYLSGPQGELWRGAGRLLERADQRFGNAPAGERQVMGEDLFLTWLDDEHRQLRIDGRHSLLLDRSGELWRGVTARSPEGAARMSGLLDALAGDQQEGGSHRPSTTLGVGGALGGLADAMR